MKFTISTEVIKSLVSRAIKGAGNNKLIPITSMMNIKLSANVLEITTTDGTNYLYVKEQPVAGDDFEVVVDANKFAKLISKMTCDNITMSLNTEKYLLNISGNGNYKIELPIDEDGGFVKYPNPLVQYDNVVDAGTTNKSTIQAILETVKPALATTLENPQYTGYYASDRVIATDSYKIACIDVPLFDQPHLVSAEFLDLVSVMRDEKIVIKMDNSSLIFSTSDCTICGKFMDGLDDFAIEPITELIGQEFDSNCSVPKNALLQMLDRISLFVGNYDKNVVTLMFTADGLQVSSRASSGVEVLPYIASGNQIDFMCAIDIQMLAQEVKAITSDAINIYYGDDSSIKLVDGTISIVLALSDLDMEIDT